MSSMTFQISLTQTLYNKMDEYDIIGWPDIQAFMDLEGFEENTTLINPNDNMGIGSSTYLVNREWIESL